MTAIWRPCRAVFLLVALACVQPLAAQDGPASADELAKKLSNPVA